MARANPIQNDFTAGLLSRRLRGRDDIQQYHSGMRQALNGLVLPHGGFMRRSGFVFVNAVKNRTGNNALIPFDVAVDQQYVCEVGHNYIRYYANHGQVESSPGVPLETVTTYGNGEQQNLRWAQQVDVMYLVHPNGQPYKLTRNSLTSFSWTQVAWKDGHAPMQPSNNTPTTATRTGVGPYTWTFSAVPKPGGFVSADDVGRYIRVYDYTYQITSVTNTTTVVTTLQHMGADPAGPSAATTDWALGLFSDTDGPRAVLFHDGRLWYGGSRTAPDVFVGSRSDDYDNFDRGVTYGGTPTFGDDDYALVKRVQGSRLQTIMWLKSQGEYLIIGSSGGEFRVFSSTSGGVITPRTCVVRPTTYRGSSFANAILCDAQVLFVHRNKREFYEHKFDIVRDNFTSRNLMLLAEDVPDSDKNMLGGLQRTAFQQSPDSIAWITHGDGSLLAITYDPDPKVNVNAVAPIRVANGDGFVNDICVIQNPTGTADELWALITITINNVVQQYVCYMDKQFRPALSYETATEAEKVKALDEAFFVDLGLRLDNPLLISSFTKTNPVVITSIAHGLSNGDRVKLRTPAGPSQLNLLSAVVANKTADTFELAGVDGTTFDDLVVVPNFSTSNPNAPLARKEVTSISGLSHLEGETLQVLADGAVHQDVVVNAGAISLTRRSSIVALGLGYTFKGQTQRLAGGAKLGTDQGQPTIIDEVAIILQNTLGGKVAAGNGEEHPADELNFREGSSNMDQSPPLFTGTKTIKVEDSWDTDPTVYFENDQPLPMTVLAVAPRTQTNEG